MAFKTAKSRPFLTYQRKTVFRWYVENCRDLADIDGIFGFYVKFYIGRVLQDSSRRLLMQKLWSFVCDLHCFYKIWTEKSVRVTFRPDFLHDEKSDLIQIFLKVVENRQENNLGRAIMG